MQQNAKRTGQGMLIAAGIEYPVKYRLTVHSDEFDNKKVRGTLEPGSSVIAPSLSNNNCRLRLESGNEVEVRIVRIVNDQAYVEGSGAFFDM